MNDTITKDKIAEAANQFATGFATMRELKGITKAEMEAVYSVGFNMYRTGRYDDAEKIFRFLVLFDHLEPKYWLGVGAVQQVRKDYQGAIASYGYASFLDLSNPKPQLHAAECFLALGDKVNAASALITLDKYCPPESTPIGREYRAKAAELRKLVGEEAFAEASKPDAETAK
jgi:type III secretion system low calcium response chaperone LcrH/SycD